MRNLFLSCFVLIFIPTIALGADSTDLFPLTHHYTGHLQVPLIPEDPSKGFYLHSCYGTFVSPAGHVLTASHCIHTSDTDGASPVYSEIHLRMYDMTKKTDISFKLTPVYDDPVFDWAILQVQAEKQPRDIRPYGWVVFDPGKPLTGENLVRTGSGSSCSPVYADDFHLLLKCKLPVKKGDSGEVLLSHDRIAGMITAVRKDGTGQATTADVAYTSLIPAALRPPMPVVMSFGPTDSFDLPFGAPLDITAVVINASATEAASGGLEISWAGSAPIPLPSGVLRPGEQRTFTYRISERPNGTYRIRYRAFFNWEDSSHQISFPAGTSSRDGKGWPIATVGEDISVFHLDDPVITLASRALDGNSAALRAMHRIISGERWQVSFEYGHSSTYEFSTQPSDSLSVAIGGLDCATEYHYRAVGVVTLYDKPGDKPQTFEGADRSFITPECLPKGISCLRGGPVGDPGTKAVNLCAAVTPNSSPQTLYFAYGPCHTKNCDSEPYTSIGYGFMGKIDGSNFGFEGLTCGTTYHGRLTAVAIPRLPPDSQNAAIKFSFKTRDCGPLEFGPGAFDCPGNLPACQQP